MSYPCPLCGHKAHPYEDCRVCSCKSRSYGVPVSSPENDACGDVSAPGHLPLQLVPVSGRIAEEDARLEKIRQERELVYGDSANNHRATGMLFTAILEYHYRIQLPHPIPPHVLCLLLAAMKLERAAAPFDYHQDNIDDAVNYTRMAADVDPRNPKEKGK